MHGSNLRRHWRHDLDALRLEKRNGALNRKGIVRNILVIGASAGGIEVLIRIFSQIQPDLDAVVAVVLHRGPIPSELLHVLSKRSTLPLIEPDQDMRMKYGTVFLAPPDHHMEFQPPRIVVQRGPKEHSTRPAIDPLFRSAARSFGTRVVGLLLSGCGDDGVNGMVAIKDKGGLCLVQDPEDADMPYMALNAIRYDHVDALLPVKSIASTLNRLVEGEVIEC
ncbi:MAG: chemotaxis protein CheB [Nitrospiraceae bacterium]